MSASVSTCVVWVRLPTGWSNRYRRPERMRAKFGRHTPQPFVMPTPDGPMYLFCVAMDASKVEETLRGVGGCICCQPAEDQIFSVSQYTPRHTVRPTGRVKASGEEEYELA